MKNHYYVVIRPDLAPPDALRTFHTTPEEARKNRTDIREVVMKVTLTSVNDTPAERVERLEHEIHTLRTLLTALNGRVAELSKVSTPPF